MPRLRLFIEHASRAAILRVLVDAAKKWEREGTLPATESLSSQDVGVVGEMILVGYDVPEPKKAERVPSSSEDAWHRGSSSRKTP